jgi:diguanylate cyclase (GGDEF)-like protein
MNDTAPEMLAILPNPAMFRTARWLQRIALGVTGLGILIALMPLAYGGFGGTSAAAARGSVPLLLTAALCMLTLLLSSWKGDARWIQMAQRVARGLALCGAATVVLWWHAAGVEGRSGQILFPPAWLCFGFVFLALAAGLVDQRNWLLNCIVDVLVCGLCLLSLMVAAEIVFVGRGVGLGGFAATLICLMCMTAVVTLRQAERGVFSIFLGVGVGSKLARIFAPILLLLPFAWQAANRRNDRLSATVLALSGLAIAFGILLVFAWRMSQMENQIHDLVLRDEATRLYNQRGFHMLAEHALRLAKRSTVPFSVLFISLDNLGKIHTQLGSEEAAASLAEAGEILRATFRESDIKGRIGANEFAVAGRFDRAGISVAALRLEAATAARGAKSNRPIQLKFSMGHVTTTDAEAPETLKDLLTRAGHAKNRMDLQLKEMRVN